MQDISNAPVVTEICDPNKSLFTILFLNAKITFLLKALPVTYYVLQTTNGGKTNSEHKKKSISFKGPF